MLKLIHIPGSTPSDPLHACVARTREEGFDGVEIVIGEGRTCEFSANEEWCHALREQVECLGTRILSAAQAENPGATISAKSEDTRLQERERIRTAAGICGRLGAEVLRIVPAVPSVAEVPRWSYQEALNETYLSLQILRGDFERAGVVGAIEACRHQFLLSPPEMRELLDRVNTPWIGAALDWAACSAHGDPRDWSETLRYRLRAVVVDEASVEKTVPFLEDLSFSGTVIITP